MGGGEPVAVQETAFNQCGLSSLVTNEVVMIVEVKALAKRIVVSSFCGLLALWRVRTLAHWQIVAI